MDVSVSASRSSGASPSIPTGDSTKGGSLAGKAAEAVADAETDDKDLVAESIDFFVSFVQVFGLPRSIGQIYGFLFVSPEPLPMDEIVSRLGISRGGASQGLALLRSLGAVTSRPVPHDRREHFQADLNVSRIVTHFFENRLRPRLDHGERRLGRMLALARAARTGAAEDPGAVVLTRIEALEKWQRRGRNVLPMIVRWLRP